MPVHWFLRRPSRAALIAGGGAFTIGFGVNQRIADSRLWPMIAGTLAIAVSTVIGMIVGHHGYALLAASAIWSFAYGLLTTRNADVAWVGQASPTPSVSRSPSSSRSTAASVFKAATGFP